MAEIVERWRPIEGFPDYEVSDLGRVKRIRSYNNYKAGKILRPCVGKNRYAHLTLCADGVQKIVSIHVIVALAFVGPKPTPLHEVNHKDFTRTNNVYTNLEWKTKSGNAKHRSAHPEWLTPSQRDPDCMASGDKHGMVKIPDAQLPVILLKLSIGVTPQQLADQYGFSRTTIRRIKDGVRKVSRRA